jgi:hypothetical protein
MKHWGFLASDVIRLDLIRSLYLSTFRLRACRITPCGRGEGSMFQTRTYHLARTVSQQTRFDQKGGRLSV